MLSKQKLGTYDELKCAETNWKMESENIMKTDLKSNIGNAEMSLAQVIKILDKRLARDHYILFTKTIHSRVRGCGSSLLGADHHG